MQDSLQKMFDAMRKVEEQSRATEQENTSLKQQNQTYRAAISAYNEHVKEFVTDLDEEHDSAADNEEPKGPLLALFEEYSQRAMRLLESQTKHSKDQHGSALARMIKKQKERDQANKKKLKLEKELAEARNEAKRALNPFLNNDHRSSRSPDQFSPASPSIKGVKEEYSPNKRQRTDTEDSEDDESKPDLQSPSPLHKASASPVYIPTSPAHRGSLSPFFVYNDNGSPSYTGGFNASPGYGHPGSPSHIGKLGASPAWGRSPSYPGNLDAPFIDDQIPTANTWSSSRLRSPRPATRGSQQYFESPPSSPSFGLHGGSESPEYKPGLSD